VLLQVSGVGSITRTAISLYCEAAAVTAFAILGSAVKRSANSIQPKNRFKKYTGKWSRIVAATPRCPDTFQENRLMNTAVWPDSERRYPAFRQPASTGQTHVADRAAGLEVTLICPRLGSIGVIHGWKWEPLG
jgi:hypothetical protein